MKCTQALTFEHSSKTRVLAGWPCGSTLHDYSCYPCTRCLHLRMPICGGLRFKTSAVPPCPHADAASTTPLASPPPERPEPPGLVRTPPPSAGVASRQCVPQTLQQHRPTTSRRRTRPRRWSALALSEPAAAPAAGWKRGDSASQPLGGVDLQAAGRWTVRARARRRCRLERRRGAAAAFQQLPSRSL